MLIIRSVYIDGADRSGFTFGVDQVTPVIWKFSNRVPKSAYSSYDISRVASLPAVQSWIRDNRQVVMSFAALKEKLRGLAGSLP